MRGICPYGGAEPRRSASSAPEMGGPLRWKGGSDGSFSIGGVLGEMG